MSLGANLRRLRQAKAWTQSDLSERTGIKVSHVSKLELDEGDPKVSTVYKLIRALECSPNALMLDPDPSHTGTHADGLLELIYERIDKLPDKAKEDLIEVLDRFCMGWEMELAVTQTPRKWREGFRTVTPEESTPNAPPEAPADIP